MKHPKFTQAQMMLSQETLIGIRITGIIQSQLLIDSFECNFLQHNPLLS